MKLFRALVTIPLAVLLVIAIRLAKRWGIIIRLAVFTSGRIGHLVGNTDIHLCEKAEGRHSYGKRTIDIWCHHGKPANIQAAKMIGRLMRIWPARIVMPAIVINKMFRYWQTHEITVNSFDRDPSNLMEKYPPWLKFTKAEKAKAEATLRSWGLPEGAQWVCLVVRDDAYLPHLSYHRYRDSEIETYRDAALKLAERGYYVIRMGAKVRRTLGVNHERVIDYATDGKCSDFMSMYLMAHCAFTLSTSTGIDSVAIAFRRPIAYVNFIPLEYLPTWLPALAIWKHHCKDNIRLTPQEIIEAKVSMTLNAEEFTFHKVSWRDNTSEEITAVAMQMADIVDGKAELPPIKEQEWFWREYPNSDCPLAGTKLHGRIRMRIGSEFLKGYEEAKCLTANASSR